MSLRGVGCRVSIMLDSWKDIREFKVVSLTALSNSKCVVSAAVI